MEIGVANSRILDIDEDLIVANLWDGNFVVLQWSIVGGKCNPELFRWNTHDFVDWFFRSNLEDSLSVISCF
jgi:hypothetical protein